MSLQTTNYKFIKPELTDAPPDITATNPNWDTIDVKLKQIETELGNTAKNVTPESIGAAKDDLSNVDGTVIAQKIQDSGIDIGGDSPSSEEFEQHTGNTTIHVTAEDKARWDEVAENTGMGYTYGTTDLEAGVTPLESGKLHFVYE